MIQKLKGQSIIEYTLLAMLVIVGTLVMGPQLIRAVNAHFKLWQEPIEDSIHDPMIRKIPNGPPLIGNCQCGDFIPGECGAHFQRSNQSCPNTKRYYYKSCTPPDCVFSSGFAEECRPNTPNGIDPTCCNRYDFCQTLPLHTLNGCCGRVEGYPRPITYDLIGLPPVTNPPPIIGDPTTYCYYGEVALINNCDPNDIRCMPIPLNGPYPDGGQCDAKCDPPIGDSTLCLGAEENLTRDLPVRIGTFCNPQNVGADQRTFVAGGTEMNYTSFPQRFNPPQNISVRVYTEDLNFIIRFFDASDVMIHEERCLFSSLPPVSPNPLQGDLNRSCGGVNNGTDPDLNIDSYQTSFLASYVTVHVEEGGTENTPVIGYSVDTGNLNCCPDYTTNPTARRCLATCNAPGNPPPPYGYTPTQDLITGRMFCDLPRFTVAPEPLPNTQNIQSENFFFNFIVSSFTVHGEGGASDDECYNPPINQGNWERPARCRIDVR